MSVNVAVVNNMVAALLSDIDEAILAQPRVNPNSSSAPVIAWADLAFRSIHQALTDLVPMLTRRLNDLETTPPSRELPPEHLRPLRSQPSACPAARSATLAAMIPIRVAPPTPLPCGSKWRRTLGPRAVQAAHALVPSAPTLSLVTGSAFTAAPIPMEFAAIAADATELRRCAAQLRRDKRLHGRSSTSS
ncbi:hypothetical protein K438DRAFT_1778989 [Mycena galopus ATCC 62051]|nr:hypothetical protein K438DRAFT_1778989 [Mycena galopus ATCC 62051]